MVGTSAVHVFTPCASQLRSCVMGGCFFVDKLMFVLFCGNKDCCLCCCFVNRIFFNVFLLLIFVVIMLFFGGY